MSSWIAGLCWRGSRGWAPAARRFRFVTARAWWHDCHDFLELTDRLKELLRGAHVCALQGGYTHDDADLVAQIRTALGKTDRSDTETETAAATPDVVRPTCPSPTGGR